jgi:single-strand DNA-binding protein
MSVNKVILIGVVGRDPETKHLDSGKVVSSFSLATDEGYKDKNGNKVEVTEWHQIVVWGSLAEHVVEKWVKKGMKLYLEGKIKTRSYDKDSVKHYVTEIYVDTLEMLSKVEAKAEGANLPPSEIKTNEPELNQPEEDDLPF